MNRTEKLGRARPGRRSSELKAPYRAATSLVIVAVTVLTLVIAGGRTATTEADPSAPDGPRVIPEVSAFANEPGLTGLSPASLSQVSQVTVAPAALRSFANANGLTGLSPASLGPT